MSQAQQCYEEAAAANQPCDRRLLNAKKAIESEKRGNTYCLINCTASSYFIPHSMSARATRTGALEGEEKSIQI